MAAKFVTKADVTVGTMAEVKAVDPDIAVGHHAVELHGHAVVGSAGREGEMLSIPADAAGKVSARAAGFVGPGKRAFDAPIVRDVQFAPGGIVELILLRVG